MQLTDTATNMNQAGGGTPFGRVNEHREETSLYGAVRVDSSHAPRATSKSLTFYPNLDSLRGIAAISVVISHIIYHFDWKTFPSIENPLLFWFRVPNLSVDLFFVISGFVVTLSSLSLFDRYPENYASIYCRRRLAQNCATPLCHSDPLCRAGGAGCDLAPANRAFSVGELHIYARNVSSNPRFDKRTQLVDWRRDAALHLDTGATAKNTACESDRSPCEMHCSRPCLADRLLLIVERSDEPRPFACVVKHSPAAGNARSVRLRYRDRDGFSFR